MAFVIKPLLNPVDFFEMSFEQAAQYLSRHMNDYPFIQTIQPWEQKRQYLQPWQKTDVIRLQFQANASPLNLMLKDAEDRTWSTVECTPVRASTKNPGFYLYEVALPLSSYPDGIYFLYLKMGAGQDYQMISNPLHILQRHKGTLYLEYKHTKFFGDVVFETGFSPSIRIKGRLAYKTPSSKDSFFEDQSLNLKISRSRPFNIWELRIGGPSGIPDLLASKFNWIMGCDTVLIDGKQFTKADGAKWEGSGTDNYPMRSWTIEVRETIGSASIPVEDDALQLTGSSITVGIDLDSWGTGSIGGTIQITDYGTP